LVVQYIIRDNLFFKIMKGYLNLRKKALEILNSKLSKDFYYHGVHHTLDVLDAINQYIKREKIDHYTAKILRISVLLHDIGFTVGYANHEENSVAIAEKLMRQYDFSEEDFKIVRGLILATRTPQKPTTDLEKMICDSDLDYLGRSDYYPISELLFKELKVYNLISNKKEWNKAQIKFLEAHKYHTEFAQKNRQPNKEMRIIEIKKLIVE